MSDLSVRSDQSVRLQPKTGQAECRLSQDYRQWSLRQAQRPFLSTFYFKAKVLISLSCLSMLLKSNLLRAYFQFLNRFWQYYFSAYTFAGDKPDHTQVGVFLCQSFYFCVNAVNYHIGAVDIAE